MNPSLDPFSTLIASTIQYPFKNYLSRKPIYLLFIFELFVVLLLFKLSDSVITRTTEDFVSFEGMERIKVHSTALKALSKSQSKASINLFQTISQEIVNNFVLLPLVGFETKAYNLLVNVL